MKIAVAQTKPVKGDISKNIERHLLLIERAVSYKADMIIFPELSITGYEPELAKDLAMNLDDPRLNVLQEISNRAEITIGVGIPATNSAGVCIGMALFNPNQQRKLYAKKYLHSSEEEFFVPGENFPILKVKDTNIALAICYELSVSEHAEDAVSLGAEIYIASAVESVSGINKALNRLSHIAEKYSMPVLMANCIGQSGIYDCAGKTAIWNNRGLLVGQLDDTNEGIVVIDTKTGEVTCANNLKEMSL